MEKQTETFWACHECGEDFEAPQECCPLGVSKVTQVIS